jgi:pimeloyl-ACP methyl ester carboxylesterase
VSRVVLLHGWPGDRDDWRAVAPLLEPGAGHFSPLEAPEAWAAALQRSM